MSNEATTVFPLDVLRACELLKVVSEDQISRLAQDATGAVFGRGDTLWSHGSKVDYVGVVASGFVKMVRLTASGHEITTEIMGPGHIFGLLGVVEGAGCPLTAKAVTHVEALRVRKEAMLDVYESSPELKERLVRRTTWRLRKSFDRIAQLAAGTVEQRIAAALMMLAESFGTKSGEGVVIDVPLTRQDISEFAGATVETTIRVMSRWQKLGWVESRAQRIELRDVEALLAKVSSPVG